MTTSLNDIPMAELGRRLRAAREAAGITQASAASAIDVARTTLVAIEQGQRRILLKEIQSLCHLYGTNVNALCREEAVKVDFEVQFRRHPNSRSGPIAQATKLLADLARAELELEALLGVKRARQNPPERPLLSGDIRAQAEEDAQELRLCLGIGLGPLQDIFSLLELSLGARLYVRKLDSSISAAFAYSPETGPCFLLNANHPRSRRVYSAAHELGHFINNRNDAMVLFRASPGDSREERYADSFARAFLTPARQTIQRFQEVTAGSSKLTRRHIILLAHYFGVSREALVRRLEELLLVKKGTWDWFASEGGITDDQVKQVLGDRLEANEASAGLREPTELRLHLLIEQVYRQGLMSEGQLAQLLRIDRLELRGILYSLGMDGEEDESCDILSR